MKVIVRRTASVAYVFSHGHSIVQYNADIADMWFGLHCEITNVYNCGAWMAFARGCDPDGFGFLVIQCKLMLCQPCLHVSDTP